MEDSRPKVLIAVPAHESMHTWTAYDLAQMTGYLGALHAAGGPQVMMYFVAGTYVHKAREDLAEAALKIGADFILWLDSDMRFPRDVLPRLVDRGCDVVGINYSTRGVPPRYTAIRSIVRNERCPTLADSTGIEEVEAIGMGVCLVRTHVLKKLQKPWFHYAYSEDGQMLGEDVWFCTALRKNGVRVFVDHDLSKECYHVGTIKYHVAHAEDAMREEIESGADNVVRDPPDGGRTGTQPDRSDDRVEAGPKLHSERGGVASA